MNPNDLGLTKTVDLPLKEAEARVKEAMAEEGFGALTQIDVQETMKKKLDVDYPPFVILGACNAPFAHKALSIMEEVSLFIPCNIVLKALDEEKTVISVVDPSAMMGMFGNEQLNEIAREAGEKIRRILGAVG